MNPPIKSDGEQYEVGDWFSLTNHATIISVDVPDRPESVVARTADGQEWIVSKTLLTRAAWAADQWIEEEAATREQLIERLQQAGDVVFTVNFRKQPDVTAMAHALSDAGDADALDTVAKRRRLCRSMLAGEERTLIGKLVSAEPKLGRVLVRDLEIAAPEHDLRLVDSRTIRWLVIRGVKYVHTQ